jgi:nucleoside triphosphate diphosphatase
MSDSSSPAPRKILADLLAVMVALRTPVTGCPWDLEQTYATIAPYTIEEAYEVADAIEKGDRASLREELGDLLLQVVYHAQIGREEGAFDFGDVVDGVTRKMIRRHPHVFGTPEQRAAGIGPDFWERVKAEERAEQATVSDPQGQTPSLFPSLLDDVPAKFPALTRAIKLQSKAAKVGFDWPDLQPVLAKVREEIAELEAEIALMGSAPAGLTPHATPLTAQGQVRTTGSDPAGLTPDRRDRLEDELGDLLFVLANVARWLAIDPEAAGRRANAKFERRFRRIEELLSERGKTPAQSDLAEMDALWDQAKREERGG